MSAAVTVIGAGLAGCEAAWQVAENGFSVELIEMKPLKYTPAHQSPDFAELICSNSLKAARVESAAGLLKEEMRRLGSLLMSCADTCRVPAGGALAVDRHLFSAEVTKRIREHRNITVRTEEVTSLPKDGLVIVATGPLTEGPLADEIFALCGGKLSFFDAAAPIVTAESLNYDRCFAASRYDHGEDSAYLNCPMNKEEYEAFYEALIHAERAPVHDFDVQNPKVYEGCMPVEVMGQRGHDTLRYGPLKPVGLRDPRTGHRPWAVVQLRREDKARHSLQSGRVPNKFAVPGTKTCIWYDSRVRTCRVCTVRSYASEYLSQFPRFPGGRLCGDKAPDSFCRANYRCRRVYGIVIFWFNGREKCGVPVAWV